MIMHMFCLKDRIHGFAAPIPYILETKELAEEAAKRDFWERYNTHTTVKFAPEDFELWYLGTYDSGSGTFIQKKSDIKCIMKGEQFNGSNKTNIPIQNSIQRAD